jgi:hypothetical protein
MEMQQGINSEIMPVIFGSRIPHDSRIGWLRLVVPENIMYIIPRVLWECFKDDICLTEIDYGISSPEMQCVDNPVHNPGNYLDNKNRNNGLPRQV